MEEQQLNIDDLFRQSGLGRDYREAPPPAVWDKIARRLDEEDNRRPVTFWLRWPWAVLSLLLLTGGTWYVSTLYGHGSNMKVAGAHIAEVSKGQEQIALRESSMQASIRMTEKVKNESKSPAVENTIQPKDNEVISTPSPTAYTPATVAMAPEMKGPSKEINHDLARAGSVESLQVKKHELVSKSRQARISAGNTRFLTKPAGHTEAHDADTRSAIKDQEKVVPEPTLGIQPLATKAHAPAITIKHAIVASGTAASNRSARLSTISPEHSPTLWPAHMAPLRTDILHHPLVALQAHLSAAAQWVNDLTSPMLEYDVILTKRPDNTPLITYASTFASRSADSTARLSPLRQPSYFTLAALCGAEVSGSSAMPFRISIGGRLLWHFNRDWALGVQPTLRWGHLSTTELTATQAYQRTTTDINGFIIQTVSPSILNAIDTIYSYAIRQIDDSIVVRGRNAQGSIWDVEIPLMLNFQRGAWRVYGGPTLSFGGRFMTSGGGIQTYSKVWKDSIVQSVPMPVEGFANYFGSASSLPQYSSYKDDLQQVADVRTGYMIGAGWQRGRLLLEASVHGQLTGYSNVPQSIKSVYSGPGVRLSVGYMIFKPAAALLKAKE